MTTNTRWATPNNSTGTTVMTTELNSLANGAYAISSAAYDNTSLLDLFADFDVQLAYTTTAPTVGAKVAEIYALPSIDGTNFATVDASNVPQKSLLIGTVETRLPSTSVVEHLIIPGVPLPPRKFKTVLKNTSGQTLKATGNQISIAPYQLQTV